MPLCQAQRNSGAETESSNRVGQRRIALAKNLERGSGIFHFTDALVVFALTQIYAAEVEAEHDMAGVPHAASHAMHDLIVHGATVQRMRMANQRGMLRVTLLRLLQQRFQPPRGPGNEKGFDTSWQIGFS